MRFVNSFLLLNKQIGAVTLLKNNIKYIKVANNPEDRKRTKYIDLRYYYLREKVINREIILN
jgi:selenocysteine-specific translation elongation factor